MKDFFEELWDEFEDFVEDFYDHILKKPSKETYNKKTAVIDGKLATIRPAYLFAERVDNAIRILFGASIVISAVTSSFIGFSSLPELVQVLISTILGRVIMLVIGFSYLSIALWKIMHLNKPL